MTAVLRLLGLAALTVFVACDDKYGQTPQSARGETPVRYVICAAGGINCFVAARFKDLDGCESHKQWAELLCDRTSTPGKMICTKDTGPTLSAAYCTL